MANPQTISIDEFLKGTIVPQDTTTNTPSVPSTPPMAPIALPNGQQITQDDFDKLHPLLKKKLLDKYGYQVDENGEPLSAASEGIGGVIHKAAHDTNPLNIVDKFGRDFSNNIQSQGGWGLSDKTKQSLGEGLPLFDMGARAADLGYRGLQSVGAALDAIPRMVLPDEAVNDPVLQALTLDHGPMGDFAAAKTPEGSTLPPEVQARLNAEAAHLINTGASKAELNAWAKKNGLAEYGPELDPVIDQRDAQTTKLKAEADAFKPTNSPKPTDVFPTDASRATDATAQEAKLQSEADAFQQGRPVEEPVPVQPEPHVQELAPPTPADTYAEDEATLRQHGLTPSHFASPEAMQAVAGELRGREPVEPVSYDGPVQSESLPTADLSISKKEAQAQYAAANASPPKSSTTKEFEAGLQSAAKAFIENKKAEESAPTTGPVPDTAEPTPEVPASTTTPVASTAPEVIDRLTAALKNAGKVREDQNALYASAKSAKLAKIMQARTTLTGQARANAERAALKGELPKADFGSVADQFSADDVNSLFDHIRSVPTGNPWTPIHADAGLRKLLTGELPTTSEISALGKTFPHDFVKTLLRKRSATTKLMEAAGNVLTAPKSLMATADFSAPFRQGIFLSSTKEFRKGLGPMFKYAFDPKNYPEIMKEIDARPNRELMQEAGVYFNDMSHIPSEREERFASPLAEQIPGYGHIVKGADRAYSGFLNKLRADYFDSLISHAKDLGFDYTNNPDALKKIGNFVNAATGRGSVGKLSSSLPLLNGLFFSPRLFASRIAMMNPVTYAKLPAGVRGKAIGDVGKSIALGTAVVMLAAAGGADVVHDSRSADFGKIKVGNTRYDISGGTIPNVVAVSRLLMNSRVDAKGNVKPFGQGYKPETRASVILQFARNKLAPVPSYITDALVGTDSVGVKFDPVTSAAKMAIPLTFQDAADTIKEHGALVGTLMAVPGLFGVGVQTYQPYVSKKEFAAAPTTPAATPTSTASPAKEISMDEFLKGTPVTDTSPTLEVTPSTANTNASTTFENSVASSVLTDELGLRITDNGIRPDKKQQELYAKYSGVAKPGTSDHEIGNAVDVAPTADVTPQDIIDKLTDKGFEGVKVITKKHGSGPHWHVQWDSVKE